MPMPDRDSNGVDILDRFLAFKYRFMQFSVTEDVFNQVVDYIKELRKERDEARREVCQFRSTSYPHDMKEVYEIADSRGWDCFKEDGK
jgi:hypothetical protein